MDIGPNLNAGLTPKEALVYIRKALSKRKIPRGKYGELVLTDEVDLALLIAESALCKILLSGKLRVMYHRGRKKGQTDYETCVRAVSKLNTKEKKRNVTKPKLPRNVISIAGRKLP